jgi:DNA/RNA endonuclease YhcR with UshA esterase domain
MLIKSFLFIINMHNQTLLKISSTIAIIGIIILLLLTNTLEPTQIKIKNINENLLNKKVQIQGNITSIKTYKESNFQIITINDSTGKIDITIDNPINITKNQTIIAIGKVTEYKNNLQIQADKITLNPDY